MAHHLVYLRGQKKKSLFFLISSSSNEQDQNISEITGSEGKTTVDSLGPTSELHDNPAKETATKDEKKTRKRGKRKSVYNKDPNKLAGNQKFMAEYLDSLELSLCLNWTNMGIRRLMHLLKFI